jgi:formate hydrogenlyase subunit 3/multisubunit Na+/H+ antiporter MnhD subunit
MAIVLAVPPFHSWIPLSAEEASPFALGLVVLILQGGGVFFTLRMLTVLPELALGGSLPRTIRWLGALAAVWPALWGMIATRLNKLAGYALVSDMGVLVIAIGVEGQEGLAVAIAMCGARAVAVAMWSLGSSLGPPSEKQSRGEVGGGRGATWGRWAAFAALLALAGFPLTSGFPARWGLLRQLVTVDPVALVAILASTAGLSLASVAWLSRSFTEWKGPGAGLSRRWEQLYVGLGLGLFFALAFFPQVLLPWVRTALQGVIAASP